MLQGQQYDSFFRVGVQNDVLADDVFSQVRELGLLGQSQNAIRL